MNIGICTIAYNDYQRFIPQWLEAIAKLDTKPTQVTIAMEKTKQDVLKDLSPEAKALNPVIIEINKAQNMGQMRNLAIKYTKTKWIMYLSVDDIILPHAIDEFMKYEKKADYIAIQWLTKGLGKKEMVHVSPLPEQMARRRGRGFIVGHSPFRRKFWEISPYENHNYPNQPFVGKMVRLGARFVQTERPCTLYLRRPDSHSKTILQGPTRIKEEKRKANYNKARMQRMIRNYYKNKPEVQ